ncbi:AraC family transcriptional regulator [Brucella abortus]|uniref:AraC family transcriptional regulator n=1 Tax=Brucella abortus TaxID=235 RepID=UPI0006E55FFB|nr:AraC family transcriptional regulator [Brucella abortus]ATA37633.1 AraC family transcriptional regulator [Brucella abortus]KPZ92498.1 AraC family transcriptional regulator [Brucella abortus]KQA01590.1 AraC family transcriptional regulator [Brucella abortus]
MNRELFLSTDMVDATQRDDFWREAVKLIYDVMSSDDQSGKGFKGILRSQQFGTCLIGSATSNGQNYQRTPSIIAQSDMDHYVLQAMIAGRMTGDFNGTNVSAKPGDIVILDLLQTVSSSVEAGERITIVIQRGELEKLVGWMRSPPNCRPMRHLPRRKQCSPCFQRVSPARRKKPSKTRRPIFPCAIAS